MLLAIKTYNSKKITKQVLKLLQSHGHTIPSVMQADNFITRFVIVPIGSRECITYLKCDHKEESFTTKEGFILVDGEDFVSKEAESELFYIKCGELYKSFTDVEHLDNEELINLSIKKWEFIAENIDNIKRFNQIETCALCVKYPLCRGCPIYARTGVEGCHKTPFDDFHRSKTRTNALREVNFLKSLLKKIYSIEDIKNGPNQVYAYAENPDFMIIKRDLGLIFFDKNSNSMDVAHELAWQHANFHKVEGVELNINIKL